MTHRLITPFAAAVGAMLLSAACGSADKPALTGRIDVTEPTEITLYYDCNGETVLETIATDENGCFTFSPEEGCKSADVTIYVGVTAYGACIEKGKPLTMTVADGRATFEGANAERSNFLSVCNNALNAWKFKPTGVHPFDADEWRTMLDEGYAAAVEAANAISDRDAREYSLRLAEGRKKYFEMQALMMGGGRSEEARARYDEMANSIDPNDDITRLSWMLDTWLNRSGIMSSEGGTGIEAIFGKIDRALTNDNNKRHLYTSLAEQFLLYQPSAEKIESFREEISEYLADMPRLTKRLEQEIERRANEISDGDLFPSDPILIDRQGNKTTLSAAIGGKAAYIDFWATWCVPCCREIPFMEKLTERFANDDRMVFISISIDDDTDAWKQKIDEDKPAWPNYIIESITGREFLDAMGINSIPRFITVGADGRIVSVKAARPSNKDIDSTLKAMLE